jgi:hypothetical protein
MSHYICIYGKFITISNMENVKQGKGLECFRYERTALHVIMTSSFPSPLNPLGSPFPSPRNTPFVHWHSLHSCYLFCVRDHWHPRVHGTFVPCMSYHHVLLLWWEQTFFALGHRCCPSSLRTFCSLYRTTSPSIISLHTYSYCQMLSE